MLLPTGQNGTHEDEQPSIDDQKGQLIAGPGAGGLQPRPSEAKKALPKLTREQEEALARAKRFAMEQSVQHVCLLLALGHMQYFEQAPCFYILTSCSKVIK